MTGHNVEAEIVFTLALEGLGMTEWEDILCARTIIPGEGYLETFAGTPEGVIIQELLNDRDALERNIADCLRRPGVLLFYGPALLTDADNSCRPGEEIQTELIVTRQAKAGLLPASMITGVMLTDPLS